MDINLASLAARADLGPLNLLQQISSRALITGNAGTVALVSQWNLAVSTPVAEAGNVYTINTLPFDFTGTTFPILVIPTFIVNNGALRSIAFGVEQTSQSQFKVRMTVTSTGAATNLQAGEKLDVLIVGRRTDVPSNPLSTLLTKRGNLGVAGM
mgnify:CR=1 FL=1